MSSGEIVEASLSSPSVAKIHISRKRIYTTFCIQYIRDTICASVGEISLRVKYIARDPEAENFNYNKKSTGILALYNHRNLRVYILYARNLVSLARARLIVSIFLFFSNDLPPSSQAGKKKIRTIKLARVTMIKLDLATREYTLQNEAAAECCAAVFDTSQTL